MSSILPAMALSNGNVLDCEAEEAPPISSNGPGAVERPSYTMLRQRILFETCLCYTNDMDRLVCSAKI